MKSKTGRKAHSKAHPRRKARARARTHRKAKPSAIAIAAPSPSSIPSPRVKICEEVEVGDIGGFGSPDELEEHEKRCGEQATQFCSTCAKNLCGSHYELLHRDHDGPSGHSPVKV